jgi:3-hydroxybutyryl-CoA dehydrogenase
MSTPISKLKSDIVGVVGAGVMGRSLTAALLVAGYKVILVDLEQSILDEANREIARELRFHRLLPSAAPFDIKELISRIHLTRDLDAIAQSVFVVENTTEDWDVKSRCHRQLSDVCRADAIIAVNTSAIPITKIASQHEAPGRIIGLHLMNPVTMKPTVEVIPGHHTTQETIDRTLEFIATINKDGILVKDSPGFVSNRVLMVAINEAAFLVHEGVASAEDADAIFVRCFGHKMGMLETADLIGIDTILRSIEVLYDSFSDPKYRPCPLLRKMVDAGLLGRKSGEGFYQYRARSIEGEKRATIT